MEVLALFTYGKIAHAQNRIGAKQQNVAAGDLCLSIQEFCARARRREYLGVITIKYGFNFDNFSLWEPWGDLILRLASNRRRQRCHFWTSLFLEECGRVDENANLSAERYWA
jgi:hypothetical protein